MTKPDCKIYTPGGLVMTRDQWLLVPPLLRVAAETDLYARDRVRQILLLTEIRRVAQGDPEAA